jgi:hypothetical protein
MLSATGTAPAEDGPGLEELFDSFAPRVLAQPVNNGPIVIPTPAIAAAVSASRLVNDSAMLHLVKAANAGQRNGDASTQEITLAEK